jgi:hypothetical protein
VRDMCMRMHTHGIYVWPSSIRNRLEGLFL